MKTSKEKARERLTICSQCPHFKPQLKQCGICHCFMIIKIWISSSKCPDKPSRW